MEANVSFFVIPNEAEEFKMCDGSSSDAAMMKETQKKRVVEIVMRS